MNKGWTYRDRIKFTDANQTVLAYYTNKYRHSTQQQWQQRIQSGQILLNSQPVSISTLLQIQDRLSYRRSPWSEPDVPLNFQVLYEDEDLLIINKPAGLPVIPGGGFLEHTLLWQLQQRYPQTKPVPVHRLGRGTSGLLLIGRSALAKSELTRLMRESTTKPDQKQISKVYRVLVQGNNFPERLVIEQPIGKIHHPVLDYIYGATPQGKYAKSECRLIKRDRNFSLVEVKITTGRPHQIRIHMAAAGYPLLGDPLYVKGGTFSTNFDGENIPVPGDCGYFLHAYALSFTHPRTLQAMSFDCPEPWLAKLDQLRI